MNYLIYDAAINGPYTLMILQKYYPVHESLFKNTKDEQLYDVGPWLFEIDDQLKKNIANELLISLQSTLLIQSKEKFNLVGDHCRKFIYQTINDREYFFRFWDARVIKKFLPDCDKKQITDFFGPIDHFIFESDIPDEAIKFWQVNGVLKQEKIASDPVFSKNQILQNN